MAKGGRKVGVHKAQANILSVGARNSVANAASKRTKDSNFDGNGDTDGNENMFVKQPTTSSKRQRTARNYQTHATEGLRPSEYAEDISCKEVRQSLVSIERGKAKNKMQLSKEIKAFKKHVEDAQKALDGHTTSITRSLSSKFTSSNDLFERAYISSLPDNTSFRNLVECLPGSADPHSNPMYIHCKKLLSESTGLLAGYRSIEIELHVVKKDILPAFDVETTFEKVLCLLDTGYKIGVRKIEKGVLGTPSTGDGSISNLDSSLYADGHEAASIWGTIVRKQENAVKKSVEAIEIQ